MKRIHIAISTDRLEEAIRDYSQRLGAEPCLIIETEFALWRTDAVNFTIRKDAKSSPGELRHFGWEDSAADGFSQSTDINGIVWERFRAEDQADEINHFWPKSNYQIDGPP